MLRLITILAFIGFYTTVNAQNSELLNGKWIFKEATNKGIDKLGRESLKSDIINKMTFEFKTNGDFVAFAFGQNMDGKWAFSNNSKSIILDTGTEKFELIILELTENRLALKLGLGEFLMKKI
jgi:hypothetical protein